MDTVSAWLLAIIVAAPPTAAYMLILWWFDRYEKEPRRLLLAAFLWGAVPAIILSLLVEVVLGASLGDLTEGAAELMFSSLLAPWWTALVLRVTFTMTRCAIPTASSGSLAGPGSRPSAPSLARLPRAGWTRSCFCSRAAARKGMFSSTMNSGSWKNERMAPSRLSTS